MKIRIAVLAGVLLLAMGQAQAGEADASVGKKLAAQELKYEVDEDGDYKLLFGLDDDRSQVVWVRSPVETLGGMRIREVLSIGGKLGKPKGAEETGTQAALVKDAMLKSSAQKLGGWVLKASDDDRVFYYVAQIPADLNAEDLETVARVVAQNGDEFEKLFESMTDADEKDTY